ncbi:MAG: DUF2891 domain-containing protein [Myxococcota bacterium]|nr:DUF2891 domain-containing protein [Myxococcota bacterium]
MSAFNLQRPMVLLAGIVFFGFISGCSDRRAGGSSSEASKSTSGNTEHPPNGLASLLAALPTVEDYQLDEKRATEFAGLSLACVDREYPNKPSHVADGDHTVKPPRELHPAFFGCFDWHSAVHGHWAMVRLLKLFPNIAVGEEIRSALNRHLTTEYIALELAYFKQEHHDLFERPYGWGWLLRLKAELDTFEDPDAKKWARSLSPLAHHIVGLTKAYLEKLSVPVRAGTHHSTAFALTHIYDYAISAGDAHLKEVIAKRALTFYGKDTDCPTAYEPSGEDFISPCLVEADLMRRVMDRSAFSNWLDDFLPAADAPEFEPLLRPVAVKDRRDPKIGHLIGLFFQRAAAFNGIAGALGPGDPRGEGFRKVAAIHRNAGLKQMIDSGYGGSHWLATFAVYLLTDAGPY